MTFQEQARALTQRFSNMDPAAVPEEANRLHLRALIVLAMAMGGVLELWAERHESIRTMAEQQKRGLVPRVALSDFRIESHEQFVTEVLSLLRKGASEAERVIGESEPVVDASVTFQEQARALTQRFSNMDRAAVPEQANRLHLEALIVFAMAIGGVLELWAEHHESIRTMAEQQKRGLVPRVALSDFRIESHEQFVTEVLSLLCEGASEAERIIAESEPVVDASAEATRRRKTSFKVAGGAVLLGVLFVILLTVASNTEKREIRQADLTDISEEKRANQLRRIIESSGNRCAEVIDETFLQGVTRDGQSFWNVACFGGQKFGVSISSAGQTKVLDCIDMRSIGIACFTKFQ